jgi:hypothetical protein
MRHPLTPQEQAEYHAWLDEQRERAIAEENARLDALDQEETLRELYEAGELLGRRLFAIGRSHPTPELADRPPAVGDPMKAAAVVAALQAAGMTIESQGSFSVTATSEGALVRAMDLPRKGWRIQNARESKAATLAALVRRPEDVQRFAQECLQAGAQ